MKISNIITDKYKLRIPPTVYYDLLADVVEAEEKKEPKTEVLDKIRAEIADLDDAEYEFEGYYKAVTDALQIIDKYR